MVIAHYICSERWSLQNIYSSVIAAAWFDALRNPAKLSFLHDLDILCSYTRSLTSINIQCSLLGALDLQRPFIHSHMQLTDQMITLPWLKPATLRNHPIYIFGQGSINRSRFRRVHTECCKIIKSSTHQKLVIILTNQCVLKDIQDWWYSTQIFVRWVYSVL